MLNKLDRPGSQFYGAPGTNWVPLPAFDPDSCRADERKVLGTCVSRSLR
jgi:hypothetical protein